MDRGTMSVNEMREYMGIGRVAAYELAHRPDFPTIRVGKRILISREGLEKWMQEGGTKRRDSD